MTFIVEHEIDRALTDDIQRLSQKMYEIETCSSPLTASDRIHPL